MDYNMYLCGKGKALVEKVERNSSTVVEGTKALEPISA